MNGRAEGMPRVLLVSNRLPVTLVRGAGGLVAQRSTGGLASALSSVHDQGGSMWFGWPGPVDAPLSELEPLLDPLRAVPVLLTPDEVRGYYDGFSNGVLWPLCHYLLDKVELDAHENWATYRAVNERFAEQVARHWRPGDLVWVHDYQLMLLPALLRERCPGARVGFFLHVPFPGPEVFRILPWREELLRGLLGADVVGFHTASYAYHFAYACSQLLGLELAGEVLQADGRPVRVGTFPIGIDAAAFDERARKPEVQARAAEIRAEAQGRTIVLSVDRLDYTKGLPRRLLALERLLVLRPELRERLHIIQLAVPTRENVDAYGDYRKTVNELVGRINGAFATPTRNLVHLMHRSVTSDELSALYLAADVMMVTPLRDGMNLVSKEYVASRIDDTGVLVLSEFAGAATELHEAMQVNPFDLLDVGDTLARAVELPMAEQRTRMAALRQTVRGGAVSQWAQSFVDALAEVSVPAVSPMEGLPPTLEALRQAPALLLALDYDGTLVDFAPSPAAAAPDVALRILLSRLAARPGTQVHVVSGRSRDSLDAFLGDLPLWLHAEHGLFTKAGPGLPWHSRAEIPPAWMEAVRPVLRAAVRRTDGSTLEEKSGSMAFHYRATEPQLSLRRAQELKQTLLAHPLAAAFDVLEGNRVLEVRQRGVNKGVVVPTLLEAHPGAAILAVGDDRTDEDLFMALPADAVSLHVGSGQSAARFHVADVAAVRALLARLLEVSP